jgi:hypothetical protein
VERPRDKPLNFVSGCGLPIVYVPFLERFPRGLVDRDLYLGKIRLENGREVSEWATFRGRRRILVRGTKDPHFRKCDQCGRHTYSALGKAYLYPDPNEEYMLFESGGFGLVLSEQLYSLLDLGEWKKLEIERAPVLDPPPDGFGELFYP